MDPTEYRTTTGTLTHGRGGRTGTPQTITVPVVDMVWYETAEVFTVSLSSPAGGTLGSQVTHAVSITDDDPAQPPMGFNGDAHPDLIWRNTQSGSNAFWFMNGPAVSTSAQFTTVADQGWEIRAVGDVNGDRQADLIWQHMGTGQHAAWLYNGTTLLVTLMIDGNPASGAPLHAETDLNWKIVTAGDMDQDGADDILWQNAVTGHQRIWHMKNLGPVTPTSLEIRDVVAISLNHDPNTTWRLVGTGDFDGDQWPDLVWRDSAGSGPAAWFMRDGTVLSSTAFSTQALDPAWRVVGVADMARSGVRDGKPDLIWQSTTGDLAVWYMDGTQTPLTLRLTPDTVLPATGWRLVGVR